MSAALPRWRTALLRAELRLFGGETLLDHFAHPVLDLEPVAGLVEHQPLIGLLVKLHGDPRQLVSGGLGLLAHSQVHSASSSANPRVRFLSYCNFRISALSVVCVYARSVVCLTGRGPWGYA